MTRYGRVVAAAVAGLALLGSHGAHAFTIVNQSNYAMGGSSGLAMADRDAALGAKGTESGGGLSFGLNNSAGLGNGPGYGGYGAIDLSNGSTSHDNFPTFPGADNHLTPGTNAGILQYGVIPHRY
ncbi:MAG: hypothetical protein EPO08_19060 [Rhodospirillaceae bacterium]|nr:MAG: hypothetical protein EPO08_19060 [Rhodospirillaceae bacterium]